MSRRGVSGAQIEPRSERGWVRRLRLSVLESRPASARASGSNANEAVGEARSAHDVWKHAGRDESRVGRSCSPRCSRSPERERPSAARIEAKLAASRYAHRSRRGHVADRLAGIGAWYQFPENDRGIRAVSLDFDAAPVLTRADRHRGDDYHADRARRLGDEHGVDERHRPRVERDATGGDRGERRVERGQRVHA